MKVYKKSSVTTYHLFRDFKLAYYSVARAKLWIAIMELVVPLKLIRIKRQRDVDTCGTIF